VDALKNLPARPEPKRPPPRRGRRKSESGPAPKKSRGRLILRRETKDRGGKVVVVVSGFAELPGANAVMIGDLARN
jgi:translation initiation factor 1 (eIF-1/SUI1)